MRAQGANLAGRSIRPHRRPWLTTLLLLLALTAPFLNAAPLHLERIDHRDPGLIAADNIEAHDVSPTTVDWNADGTPDFVGGRRGWTPLLSGHPPDPGGPPLKRKTLHRPKMLP